MGIGKYGSSSFSVFLADGYNLLASKVKAFNHKVENILEKSDGLGDSWEESSPSGSRRATMSQAGGFFDDTQNGVHDVWKKSSQLTVNNTPTGPSRIVCVAWAGNVIGRAFTGLEGAFFTAYEVLSQIANLTKANATYIVTGQDLDGVILQEWATRTDDWNTKTEGNTVDNGASSANGGVGFLQVSGFAGPNAITVKIRHSADGVTLTDLITFTVVSGAQIAQRVVVAGTVQRQLWVETSGFGHVSPSASTSASRSPSGSASASSSPSLSPSASISPSASTSLSPSASISPSASTSLSPSASTSISPSSSRSPSASQSPSASVSPSAGAGPASSIKLFVGFART